MALSLKWQPLIDDNEMIWCILWICLCVVSYCVCNHANFLWPLRIYHSRVQKYLNSSLGRFWPFPLSDHSICECVTHFCVHNAVMTICFLNCIFPLTKKVVMTIYLLVCEWSFGDTNPVWRLLNKYPPFSYCQNMDYTMTSSNGNIFLVTGPLYREYTGDRWITLTKASDAELWCFLWSMPG